MDLSKITEDLFIGTTPSADDYAHLRELGIRLVINMRIEKRSVPDTQQPPLSFLWLPSIDSPFFPIPIRFLARGAQMALQIIDNGGKVLAHCAGGRHRGVAMGAAILIAQGYDPGAAMRLIKECRSSADPDIFYIRQPIFRFTRHWQAAPPD